MSSVHVYTQCQSLAVPVELMVAAELKQKAAHAVAAAQAAQAKLKEAEAELARCIEAGRDGNATLESSGFRITCILEHCTHTSPTRTLGGSQAKYAAVAEEVGFTLSRAGCRGAAGFDFQVNERWRVVADDYTARNLRPMVYVLHKFDGITSDFRVNPNLS